MLSDFALSLLRALLSPFPDSVGEGILRLGLRDSIFLGASALIALLCLSSIGLASWAFFYRARRETAEQKQADFQRYIRPQILRVLSEEISPGSIGPLVPPSRELAFLQLLLEFEDRVRGREQDLVRAMARPFLGIAEGEVFATRSERRSLAVRCLGVLGLPDYEKTLLDALSDPSDDVAIVAAYALAERGGSRYAIPILSHLQRFERWSPRYLAEMLSAMGEEILPDLHDICLDEGRPAAIRAIAADAMRLIGYPQAADTAARILEQGETSRWRGERETRIAALRILAVLGRPEHLSIVRRLSHDPDPVIREVSVTALGAFGTHQDLPFLIEELNGSSRWVALEAARSIRALQEAGEAEGEIRITPERIPLFLEVLGG